MGELIIILLIVLVVFGASKLPAIGDALGRSIKNFKRATKVEDDKADDKDDELEGNAAKQLAVGRQQKQIEQGTAQTTQGADDAEWEEVVVRRRKKSADS
jgi:sec-independent protein translocase protein TatA